MHFETIYPEIKIPKNKKQNSQFAENIKIHEKELLRNNFKITANNNLA